MKQLFANNAKTTLSLGIGPSDLTLVVSDASRFPIPASANQYFEVTLELGDVIEVVRVTGRIGNTLSVAVGGRGIDGTIASTFGAGTKVECRVSAGLLSRFTTGFADGPAVEAIVAPSASFNDGYICSTLDSYGNPVIIYSRDADTWRSLTYTVTGAVAAASGTSTTAVLPGGVIGDLVSGRYLVHITSGANKGTIRSVSGYSYAGGNGTFTWTVPLAAPIGAGDIVEIWKDNPSFLSNFRINATPAVSQLNPPATAETNLYICTDLDDYSNNVLAQASAGKWTFPSHQRVRISGVVAAGSSTTQVVATAIGSALGVGSFGTSAKYLIQFTSGALAGRVRKLGSSGVNSASWVTALPSTPANGDTFEIYQSNASTFAAMDAIIDEALVNAIVFGG